ncbi:hypothetical protein niasHT_036825 [Heterodera trifolii]|uniref:Uncharacterized protein n=1 Tax=Heterodera trifolii TaxID=157864 RepID=A0ABD2IV83_9BILA
MKLLKPDLLFKKFFCLESWEAIYYYYYGTEDSSREFDASADEEDELYEEEDEPMSGQTYDYGIGIGQEYGTHSQQNLRRFD